jgi:hypothetical protein
MEAAPFVRVDPGCVAIFTVLIPRSQCQDSVELER